MIWEMALSSSFKLGSSVSGFGKRVEYLHRGQDGSRKGSAGEQASGSGSTICYVSTGHGVVGGLEGSCDKSGPGAPPREPGSNMRCVSHA
eukprot:801525-Rhodomonas_salina.1